jgi:hypothetical protein
LFLFSFFFVALVVLPAKPAEARRLCYCRLTNLSNLTESDEQKFCRSEVAVVGSVSDSVAAGAECLQMCQEDGNEYIGLSESGPAERPYDAALVETGRCLFSKNSHSENDTTQTITGWTDNNNNCRSPLNSIPSANNRNGALPSSCSFCFCKYKSNVSPAACAGKTVYMHATGAPNECSRFCEDMGMDSAGAAVSDYNALCDYKSSDNCGAPKNPAGKCGEVVAGVARDLASARFQANRGSALGQLLPLGDIELPSIIARIIRQLLSVVGAIALVFFIWGGIKYMTAAGDEKKIAEARNMLVTTISGLIAIFVSYALLSLLINVLN